MIVMTLARKPIKTSVVDNIIERGTGALNIDECRIQLIPGSSGRFPSNVIFEHKLKCRSLGLETPEQWVCEQGCPVEHLNQTVGITKSGEMDSIAKGGSHSVYSNQTSRPAINPANEGYVSRFFFQVQPDVVANRASHLCICENCGKPYWKHPSDGRYPFLTVLCSGERVKL